MKKNSKLGLSYFLLINIWLIVFFFIFILIILLYFFLKRGIYGGVEFKFLFEIFNIFIDKVFLKIFINIIYIFILIIIFIVLFVILIFYYIVRLRYK